MDRLVGMQHLSRFYRKKVKMTINHNFSLVLLAYDQLCLVGYCWSVNQSELK